MLRTLEAADSFFKPSNATLDFIASSIVEDYGDKLTIVELADILKKGMKGGYEKAFKGKYKYINSVTIMQWVDLGNEILIGKRADELARWNHENYGDPYFPRTTKAE